MRKLGALTAAAAMVAVVGFSGAARAEIVFPFDVDLMVYYSFDDDSNGALAPDNSANTNDGTISGAVYDSGELAPVPGNVNSLSCDGTDDTVFASDDGTLTPSADAVTIAAWINVDSTTDDEINEIAGKWNDGVREYQIQIKDDDGNGAIDPVVDFTVKTTVDGGATFKVATSGTIPLDTWVHVAAVYDGANMQVYLNGLPSGAATAQTGNLNDTAARFSVCAQDFGGGDQRFLDGNIDEVRVYDAALTGEQIAQLASGFPGTVEKELVSGPNDRLGSPIVVDVNPLDDGGILVLSPDTQRFEFKITITNDGENGAIDGLKIFDVVGAEFDPDCDAEDGTINDPLGTEDCPDNGDDGIAVTGGTGDCTATITSHDSGRKLDPHFILIVLDDLEAGETCEVTVWVNTDENPSSVRKGGGNGEEDEEETSSPLEKFSPTSCDLVMEPDLFNTFTLNEGLKVFDPDSGIRLLGPVGSLQLTCNFPE